MMRNEMLSLSVWHKRAVDSTNVKTGDQIIHWTSKVGKSAHALRR